jgi:hypothetical protein
MELHNRLASCLDLLRYQASLILMEIFFLVGEEPAGFHLVVDPPGFEEGMEGGRLVIVYVDRIE